MQVTVVEVEEPDTTISQSGGKGVQHSQKPASKQPVREPLAPLPSSQSAPQLPEPSIPAQADPPRPPPPFPPTHTQTSPFPNAFSLVWEAGWVVGGATEIQCWLQALISNAVFAGSCRSCQGTHFVLPACLISHGLPGSKRPHAVQRQPLKDIGCCRRLKEQARIRQGSWLRKGRARVGGSLGRSMCWDPST